MFLQTAKEVWIFWTEDKQVRRVYMDVPHSADPKPSWYGESVGHYEGDTLVIDTIGLNDKTFVDIYRTPHTEKLHVVERWRMVDGGQMMEAMFTVDDPDAFYQPWSGNAALSARAAAVRRKHLRREQYEYVRLSHAGGGEAGFLKRRRRPGNAPLQRISIDWNHP